MELKEAMRAIRKNPDDARKFMTNPGETLKKHGVDTSKLKIHKTVPEGSTHGACVSAGCGACASAG